MFLCEGELPSIIIAFTIALFFAHFKNAATAIDTIANKANETQRIQLFMDT